MCQVLYAISSKFQCFSTFCPKKLSISNVSCVSSNVVIRNMYVHLSMYPNPLYFLLQEEEVVSQIPVS